MPDTRIAARLVARGQMDFCALDMPKPNAGEVLMRVKAVGVCGSDVAYYRTGRTGVGEIKFPHITGHECAGTVASVGPGVTSVAPGDRVTTEPGFYCGKCEACLTGRYNLCRDMSFMGSAAAGAYGEGALIEYVVRPARLVFKLPDSVSFAEGAMLEPLSVGLHAARRAGVGAGDRVAILGSGPIAMSLLLVLKCLGIGEVTVTDLIPQRLAFAKKLGADRAIDAFMALEESSLDAVFDTTCNENAINGSLGWLKKGGKLVQIGVPVDFMRLDAKTLFIKGISLIPSFRYANTYPALINLVASGRLSALSLITDRFPFAQTPQAFALAASRAPGVMKVLIEFE